MKKIAVISFTEKGRKLSLRISESCSGFIVKRFCFHTHSDSESEVFSDTSIIAKRLFEGFDGLIFVCACGIAVRTISPYIKSKQTDPAVIVVDDCGKFVIPILSGHLGGANVLSKLLADKLCAQAVITTATDTGGKFSPDSFAEANGLLIKNIQASKKIASAILDGEKIGLVSDYEYINKPDEFFTDEICYNGIYIGVDESNSPFPLTLSLIPKNLVLGIGCRKGVFADIIEESVISIFNENGISFERVCAVASIDIKAHEQGLIEFCSRHKLTFNTYSAAELMKVDGDFSSSEFVKATTGVDNVCERSAVKCSGGTLVIPKNSRSGVTVAAAGKPLLIDFERTIL